MIIFKLPVHNGNAIGAFTYSTGSNLGDGVGGGTNHKVDVASADLDQTSLKIIAKDETFNPGELIDLEFKNAAGDLVTVNGATIQRSDGRDPSGERQLEGRLYAVGKDQNNEDIAVLINFNKDANWVSTTFGFDTDQDANTIVALDKPLQFLYLGNYADADTSEDNNTASATAYEKFGATSDGKLALVTIQPIDADGSNSDDVISDNDKNQNLGDYIIYTNPETGTLTAALSDSSVEALADVTYFNEKGEKVTENIKIVAIQMTNGNVFISGVVNDGPLDNKNITAIDITSVTKTDFVGFNDSVTIDKSAVVCFTKSTPIRTLFGDVVAGDLRAGDLVETVDNGPQPILWIGRRHIDNIDLSISPKLFPVRIRKGTMGENIPTEDILVSRQHRMLVRSKIARNMFGSEEVLVPAIKLIDLPGIEIATDVTEVIYLHFIFDQHELVFAANAPSESLFTGPEALKMMSEESRRELFALFPQLEMARNPLKPVREFVSNKPARNLVMRHIKNVVPLVHPVGRVFARN